MKTYLAVFRLRLINGFQYRIAALAGVATQFFWGFILIMVYEAFYSGTQQAQPISLGQLVSYIWLQQAFLVFVMLWFRDWEIFNLITSGNIGYELCRPCGLYGLWYARLLAQRFSGALLRCLPILLVAFFLPEPYRLQLPHDTVSFCLFVLTLALGLQVTVSISMLVYISVFKTMSPTGSLLMVGVVGEFMAGSVIPVPLMPQWLQHLAYILPFRYASDLPFRVYSGNIGLGEAFTGILVQIIWIAALVIAGKLAMSKILKHVVIQGG